MANTKSSAKRARQAVKKQAQNQAMRTKTRSALKLALDTLAKKDVAKAKEAYAAAIKALSTAGRRGTIPARRAARKISRLTLLVKNSLPEILPFKN